MKQNYASHEFVYLIRDLFTLKYVRLRKLPNNQTKYIPKDILLPCSLLSVANPTIEKKLGLGQQSNAGFWCSICNFNQNFC